MIIIISSHVLWLDRRLLLLQFRTLDDYIVAVGIVFVVIR
jgi:hypothetical protein